jgi:hypothetical protein
VNIVAPGLADTESGVCPVPLYPNSGTCVLPITIAPAAITRSTAAPSSSGMKTAQPYEPEAAHIPGSDQILNPTGSGPYSRLHQLITERG